MEFERVELGDVENLYIRMHERWWSSHGEVMVYIKNQSVAFTPPAKPMRLATVALITTGGAHLNTQPPFDLTSRTGDSSVRFIPNDAPYGDLLFTHDHYDHTSADKDPNCMFPLEHLQALASERVIGASAPVHVGLSGWIPRPDALLKSSVPKIIERFKADAVDVALLTGG